MKKHLVLICASVAFVSYGIDSASVAQASVQTSKNTSELRSAGAASLASSQELTLMEIIGLDDIALNDFLNASTNSPNVTTKVMAAAKKDDRVMKALLAKLENNINYRDQMLVTLLNDPEFCALVVSPKFSGMFPKTASTLSQATSALPSGN
ncbi:MAG: hypothetical protein JSS34_01100 [Proteobacteria bacterium]|nr:hypothetical protein [Pseudomonadota bacterium]